VRLIIRIGEALKMDIESLSVLVLASANLIVLLGVGVYLFFYFKWDTKSLDPLAVNVKNRVEINQNWDNISNVESLLDKGINDSSIGGAGIIRMKSGVSSIGFGTAVERNALFNDITSIGSRRVGGTGGPGSVFSHRYSILTRDREHSLLGYGMGNRYAAS